MTFEDLKGCLILLSYDMVRPEDESQTWHNVLPYTFEDGCLLVRLCFGSMTCLKTMATWCSSRSNRRMARKPFFHKYVRILRFFEKYTISPENLMWKLVL